MATDVNQVAHENVKSSSFTTTTTTTTIPTALEIEEANDDEDDVAAVVGGGGSGPPRAPRPLLSMKRITKGTTKPSSSVSSFFSYRCSMCWIVSFVVLGSLFLAISYRIGGSGDTTLFLGEGKNSPPQEGGGSQTKILGNDENSLNIPSYVRLPSELIGLSYVASDFSNDAGVTPTYWNCSRVSGDCDSVGRHYGVGGGGDWRHNRKKKKKNSSNNENNTNDLSHMYDTWGPCFVTANRHIKWETVIEQHKHIDEKNSDRQQQDDHSWYYASSSHAIRSDNGNDVRGLCRPGFVILGAGKCGTSSLYHYLVDHPKVLPARQKQIHYFKYFVHKSMRWYLMHFPTAIAFLSSGALMTGEASPGYLPYPEVAPVMAKRMPGSRMIVVGRNPIDRMYSSFQYSYISATIAEFRNGRVPGVPTNLSVAEYQDQYLFSFEDTIRAELMVLRKCLTAPNGSAIINARKRYGPTIWGQKIYAAREKQGLPPLVDLDRFCYGERVSRTVLRPQWKDLMQQYPQKVIIDINTHLLQSHVGRSLYALSLEWWYAHFDANDIFFMCTENMKDLSGASMEPLRQWLGLPIFNFSNTLKQGAYNVGGHLGYDKQEPWDSFSQPNSSGGLSPDKVIPLSDEFRQELETFVRPYNERLFKLVGKRCQW